MTNVLHTQTKMYSDTRYSQKVACKSSNALKLYWLLILFKGGRIYIVHKVTLKLSSQLPEVSKETHRRWLTISENLVTQVSTEQWRSANHRSIRRRTRLWLAGLLFVYVSHFLKWVARELAVGNWDLILVGLFAIILEFRMPSENLNWIFDGICAAEGLENAVMA